MADIALEKVGELELVQVLIFTQSERVCKVACYMPRGQKEL